LLEMLSIGTVVGRLNGFIRVERQEARLAAFSDFKESTDSEKTNTRPVVKEGKSKGEYPNLKRE